jgi:dihydroflavonol-4-reductase
MSTPPKVLVTGASGFLGARIVRQLLEAGEHVKAFVRGTSSLAGLRGLDSDRLEVVIGDVMIASTVYGALAGCDRMFHVAAVNQFWDRKPQRIIDAAEIGTRETLEAARRRKLSRVVYTSSVVTLGKSPSPEPMDESHAFNIASPDAYVEGKRRAEAIATERAADLPIVITMPSSLYGPGDHKPTPVGQGLLRFLTWSMPLLDFPVTAAGMNVADVDDVARGHLLAMQKGTPGERYILGGDDLTFEELFTLAAEITGLPGPGAPSSLGTAELLVRLMDLHARWTGETPPVTHKMVREYGNDYVYVTSAKAESALGYTHRPARRALARSVQFFLEHGFLEPRIAKRIRVDLRVPTLD